MPFYPTTMRFADLRESDFPQGQSSQFVRMPDGSLVMTGQRQMQTPSILDRLKAAATAIIPSGLTARASEPAVPWWIAQPQAALAPAQQQVDVPGPMMGAKGQDAWNQIAREAAREEALASQLGDVSKRILSSPQLVEGKWGINPFR